MIAVKSCFPVPYLNDRSDWRVSQEGIGVGIVSCMCASLAHLLIISCFGLLCFGLARLVSFFLFSFWHKGIDREDMNGLFLACWICMYVCIDSDGIHQPLTTYLKRGVVDDCFFFARLSGLSRRVYHNWVVGWLVRGWVWSSWGGVLGGWGDKSWGGNV